MALDIVAEYVEACKENYEETRNKLADYLVKDYGLDSSEMKEYIRCLEMYRATLNLGRESFQTVKENLEYKIMSAARHAGDGGYMNSTCAVTRAAEAVKLAAMCEVFEDMKRMESRLNF